MRKCCCSGSGQDINVKITTNDTTTGFLADKVVAGAGISLAVLNPGADEDLEITNTNPVNTDRFVAVTGADTTPGNLAAKVVAGANITLAVLNPGADEDLEITAVIPPAVDRLVEVTGADTTPGGLAAKIVAGAGISLATLNPGADEDLEITATGVPPAETLDGFDTTPLRGFSSDNDADTVAVNDPNCLGGAFKLIKPMSFNRLVVRLRAVTALGTGPELVVALYEQAGGETAASYALVDTFTLNLNAVGAPANLEIANDAGGLLSMARGNYFLLWGNTDQSGPGAIFTMRTWLINSVSLYTSTTSGAAPGTAPATFSAAVDLTAPPATIDPRTFAIQNTPNPPLIHRFKRV